MAATRQRIWPISVPCATMGARLRHIEQEPPQDEALLLVSDKEEAAMQEALTGDYSMEKLFRTDRRSCDMRSPINLYRITKK